MTPPAGLGRVEEPGGGMSADRFEYVGTDDRTVTVLWRDGRLWFEHGQHGGGGTHIGYYNTVRGLLKWLPPNSHFMGPLVQWLASLEPCEVRA